MTRTITKKSSAKPIADTATFMREPRFRMTAKSSRKKMTAKSAGRKSNVTEELPLLAARI